MERKKHGGFEDWILGSRLARHHCGGLLCATGEIFIWVSPPLWTLPVSCNWGEPLSRSEPFILAAPLSRKKWGLWPTKTPCDFFWVLSTCRHPILGLVSATSESTHISMAALTWPPGWLLQPNLLAGIAPDRSCFFYFYFRYYSMLFYHFCRLMCPYLLLKSQKDPQILVVKSRSSGQIWQDFGKFAFGELLDHQITPICSIERFGYPLVN